MMRLTAPASMTAHALKQLPPSGTYAVTPRRRNSLAIRSAGSDMPPGLSRTTSLMLGGMVLTILSRSLTMDP